MLIPLIDKPLLSPPKLKLFLNTESYFPKKQPHLIQPVSPPLYFCESLALLNSSLSYLGSSFLFRHGQSQSSAFNGGHFESALSLSWAGHFLLTEQSARVCTC
tara:strand:- start:1736 stop:2044 length:309 start_codon:yes stop_codon:yes gene_type:complete